MRYNLTLTSTREALASLGSELSLYDEIALLRLTIQDLVGSLEQQVQPAQKIVIGSMLRDAIETLSRVVERASKLPASPNNVPTSRVAGMLKSIEQAIHDSLPEGPTKDQLIMNVQETLNGISVREAPSVTVLRTCEMMDRSIPYVPDDEPDRLS